MNKKYFLGMTFFLQWTLNYLGIFSTASRFAFRFRRTASVRIDPRRGRGVGRGSR